MPFTFSHPAIVLPLYYLPKKIRSLTGLVIGSIVPDFEKFFRMSIHDGFSHTWPAIFYFNLPLAILLSFVFHQVVRDPLIDNLPLFLKKRLVLYKGFNWGNYFQMYYLKILLSLLIGILSHLAWDSFTHPESKLTELMPILLKWVRVLNYSMPLSILLDRVSSIIGGLGVLGALLNLSVYNLQTNQENEQKYYWFMFASLAFLILTIRVYIGFNQQYFIWDYIVSIISALLLSVVLTSLITINL